MPTEQQLYDDTESLKELHQDEVPSVSVDHAKAHQAGMREGIQKAMMASQAGAAGAQQQQQPLGHLQLNNKTQGQLAGMGMPPQQGQLNQPQAGPPPSMQEYIAQKQAAQQAAQPQTGASSPTTLNPEQFTQTQLQNLESHKDITKEQANIAGKQSDEEAGIQIMAADKQAKMLADQEAFQQKAMGDAKERDDALHTQIQQMGMKKNQVDPNHWWNSKSTGGKIASTIGMFLMTLGNPQVAMERLHHTIDADMNAQQDNINNSWKKIQAQHGLDDTATNRDNHMLEWKNQFRIGSMEVVKQQLLAAASRYKNPMTQQNALMAVADIDKEKDKIRNDNWNLRQKQLASQGAGQAALQKRMDEQHKEYAAHYIAMTDPNTGGRSEQQADAELNKLYPELVQYGRVLRAGGGGMSTEVPVNKSDKNAARVEEKDLESRSVKIPEDMGGGVGVTRDAAAAKDYTERVGTTISWMKKLERVKQLQADWKAGKLDAAGTAEWEALAGDMTNTMNGTFAVTRQAGVGEGERIDEHILPKPPGWFMRNMGTGAGYTPGLSSYMQSQNDGRIKAIEDLMKERKVQALQDITPLRSGLGVQSKTPDKVSSELPSWAVPKTTGPAPKAIPFEEAKPPGIPSFQQYQGR